MQKGWLQEAGWRPDILIFIRHSYTVPVIDISMHNHDTGMYMECGTWHLLVPAALLNAKPPLKVNKYDDTTPVVWEP